MPKMPEMSGMHMPEVSHDHPDPNATFGTHGMLLFGEETLYLSHLPMFMSPHNFQVILAVTLNDQAAGRLRDFRAHFGRNDMYTFKPKKFHITDLISRHPGKPALTSFGGSLFRFHFERGGESISEQVKVHVTEVLYFQELGAASPKAPSLNTCCLGKVRRNSWFIGLLSHRILTTSCRSRSRVTSSVPKTHTSSPSLKHFEA